MASTAGRAVCSMACPSGHARTASSLGASSSSRELHVRPDFCVPSLLARDLASSGSCLGLSHGRASMHLESGAVMSFLPSGMAHEWWRKPSLPHGGLFGLPGSMLDWSTPDFKLSGPERRNDDADLLEGTLLSTDTTDWAVQGQRRDQSAGVPVYVMLPLDSVTIDNKISRPRAFPASLTALKSAGVEGVMMDVWWGIVERDGPGTYRWDAYEELVSLVKDAGLKMQVVMSFHQCGGNVGDHCSIPLPPWVLQEVEANPDIAYTDKLGARNKEYISLGCDDEAVLCGRTPMEVYEDFMRSFRKRFRKYLGDVITEIQVGMGPAGELRYPSYPEQDDQWRFPGIGEFQCYDKYMLANLRQTAEAVGKPLWGRGGPHDAGSYKQWPEETGFFCTNGSWKSSYGDFFLQWYSGMLLAHGDRVLQAAKSVFGRCRVHVSGKVAGIHWHYWTHSHAAELTAGYYNTVYRDGYQPLAQLFAKHGATLNFTCFEMRDQEQPMWAGCSPECLLRQVVGAAKLAGASVSGENALPRMDTNAHEQIIRQSRLQFEGVSMDAPMASFTFLRMSERLFHSDSWTNFVLFVRQMKEGRTFQPWEKEHENSYMHVRSIGPLSQAAAELMLR